MGCYGCIRQPAVHLLPISSLCMRPLVVVSSANFRRVFASAVVHVQGEELMVQVLDLNVSLSLAVAYVSESW